VTLIESALSGTAVYFKVGASAAGSNHAVPEDFRPRPVCIIY
jgi:hypothetical protein